MNAQTLNVAGGHMLDFDSACARLNEWRGHMVENFARSEQAVTETLALLNATSSIVQDGKGTKFPHLVGQRYDRLAALLSAPSQPSGHCKVALSALERFRTHDALRTMLCHGVAKIALDRAGQWVAVMTMVSFKASQTLIDRLTLEEDEAGVRLGQLIDDRRRVSAALGQVRREISQLS